MSMRVIHTTRGDIRLHPIEETNKSDFTPVDGWKLLRTQNRKAETPEGVIDLIHERWVHPESRSGIVFFTNFEIEDCECWYGWFRHNAGEVYYVIEGYGIGTIDPKTFKEISAGAPIQRMEARKIEDARKLLTALMQENTQLWKERMKRNEGARVKSSR